MPRQPRTHTIIGRAERITLPDFGLGPIPAKVDTGADLSSIWVSDAKIVNDRLEFAFFGPESPYYTGELVCIAKEDFRLTRVANSFGHREMRYVIKLNVGVGGRKVRATFTLSDRSLKLYPILLGRKLLAGRFLVDVSQGAPLEKEERRERRELEQEIKALNTKLKRK